jgi:hypothetical protein
MMLELEPLSEAATHEQVLTSIPTRNEAYARRIARFYGKDLYAVQQQLAKLESGDVLANRTAGKTRLYSFNPGGPFLKPLKVLLEKTLSFRDGGKHGKLKMNRRRPRRRGKPL